VWLQFLGARYRKLHFLKALGPFLACVIGMVVVVATGNQDGKGPIKIVKKIPSGEDMVAGCVRVCQGCYVPQGPSQRDLVMAFVDDQIHICK